MCRGAAAGESRKHHSFPRVQVGVAREGCRTPTRPPTHTSELRNVLPWLLVGLWPLLSNTFACLCARARLFMRAGATLPRMGRQSPAFLHGLAYTLAGYDRWSLFEAWQRCCRQCTTRVRNGVRKEQQTPSCARRASFSRARFCFPDTPSLYSCHRRFSHTIPLCLDSSKRSEQVLLFPHVFS
jgi:hypothetical protein